MLSPHPWESHRGGMGFTNTPDVAAPPREISRCRGAAAALTADQPSAPGTPSTRRALNTRSRVGLGSPHCDHARRARQQTAQSDATEVARPKQSCSTSPYLSLITAPGTVPPLSPGTATVQYESAQVFGEEHHAQLNLLRVSNYNVVCWCLWGPAIRILAAPTCCSRQISCIDPGTGCQPQVGRRRMCPLRKR